MAILKTLLDEAVLTSQERNVLRSIYRETVLVEGLVAIEKVVACLDRELLLATQTTINSRKQYLLSRIRKSLEETKVPATPILATDVPQPSRS